jgi:hypothetical protein
LTTEFSFFENNALLAIVLSWLMTTAFGVVSIVIPNHFPSYALMHMIGVTCFDYGEQFSTAAMKLPVLKNTGVTGRL